MRKMPTRIGLCPVHGDEFYYPLVPGESPECPTCGATMTVFLGGRELEMAIGQAAGAGAAAIMSKPGAEEIEEILADCQRIIEEDTTTGLELEGR